MAAEKDFVGYVKDNQPPFDLYVVDEGTGGVKKHMTVTSQIISNTMIAEADLAAQVSRVSGEIAHWGVMEAKAHKAWQRGELEYRVWREVLTAKLLTPPKLDGMTVKDWKKPTEAAIEAHYRSHPEYLPHQRRLQDLEESYNSCHAILEGFKAKKEMLRAAVRRAVDDAAPRLAV